MYALTIGYMIVFGIINRLRGGMWPAERLPGRPLIWMLPVVFLVALTILSWKDALWFTVGYASWASFAWGRWFTLGRDVRGANRAAPNWFERIIERIGGKSDHACLFIRDFILLLPVPWLIWIAGWRLGAYEIGMRVSPGNASDGVVWGEWLTGFGWGLALVITYFFLREDFSFLFLRNGG